MVSTWSLAFSCARRFAGRAAAERLADRFQQRRGRDRLGQHRIQRDAAPFGVAQCLLAPVGGDHDHRGQLAGRTRAALAARSPRRPSPASSSPSAPGRRATAAARPRRPCAGLRRRRCATSTSRPKALAMPDRISRAVALSSTTSTRTPCSSSARNMRRVDGASGLQAEAGMEVEGRAWPAVALHPDAPAHQLHQVPRDARPRPVPPYLRVVEVSAWLNDWNRRAHCSGVMPMPVSLHPEVQHRLDVGSLTWARRR